MSQEIRSGSKSIVEVCWGIVLTLVGGCLPFVAFEFPSPGPWVALGISALMLSGGIYMLFSYSQVVLDPPTRTWKEISGWLTFSKAITGKFADFKQVTVIRTQGNKLLPTYTIFLEGKSGSRELEIIYDVVHSDEKMIEIVTLLRKTLGVPVEERSLY